VYFYDTRPGNEVGRFYSALSRRGTFESETRAWSCDDVVVLTASKFCEKYYGQDSPGASHLAMTNLSKLCAALSTLTGPTTVSHRQDVLYHGGLLLIGTVSGSLTVFSIAHSQTSSSVRRSLCYVNSRT